MPLAVDLSVLELSTLVLVLSMLARWASSFGVGVAAIFECVPLKKWAVLELPAWALMMLLLLMVSGVEAVGAVLGSDCF